MGYVYILDPGFLIKGDAVVKIGSTTRHPRQRIRELQTGNPNKIQLVGFYEFSDPGKAEHNQLSPFRIVHGGGAEFFATLPAEADRIVQNFAFRYSKAEADRQFSEDLDKYIHDLIWPSFKKIFVIL